MSAIKKRLANLEKKADPTSRKVIGVLDTTTTGDNLVHIRGEGTPGGEVMTREEFTRLYGGGDNALIIISESGPETPQQGEEESDL